MGFMAGFSRRALTKDRAPGWLASIQREMLKDACEVDVLPDCKLVGCSVFS
jgi:hypothetical protein